LAFLQTARTDYEDVIVYQPGGAPLPTSVLEAMDKVDGASAYKLSYTSWPDLILTPWPDQEWEVLERRVAVLQDRGERDRPLSAGLQEAAEALAKEGKLRVLNPNPREGEPDLLAYVYAAVRAMS
jgi:hypothetical protein